MMREFAWRRNLILGWMLCGLVAGCGRGDSSSQANPPDSQYLTSLAEDYRMYSISHKRPPAKVADLQALKTMASPAVAKVNNGEIVVEWGAKLPSLNEDAGSPAAPEILAYGKDVPTQGGYVLHLDRTVSEMSADEFKAAPKAGGN